MAIHNKGGSDSPYEKYHLSKETRDNASRLATNDLDGLMPKELYGVTEEVTPPTFSGDTGELGQWAQDTVYMYYCIGTNQWVRIKLNVVVDLGFLMTDEEIGDNSAVFIFEDGSQWNYEPASL